MAVNPGILDYWLPTFMEGVPVFGGAVKAIATVSGLQRNIDATSQLLALQTNQANLANASATKDLLVSTSTHPGNNHVAAVHTQHALVRYAYGKKAHVTRTAKVLRHSKAKSGRKGASARRK